MAIIFEQYKSVSLGGVCVCVFYPSVSGDNGYNYFFFFFLQLLVNEQ